MVIEFARIRANVIFHSVLFRSIGVALYLTDGRIFVRNGNWWSRFMRLAGRSVHDHHPGLALVLVVRGEHYVVSFANSVKIKSVKNDVQY